MRVGEVEHEAVEHPAPKEIIAELRQIEREISRYRAALGQPS